MESSKTHSKAKLALAVFTSPAAAFEEITSRKLLGTALSIITLAGFVSTAPIVASGLDGDRLQYLLLSKYNPIMWLGLCMLYTLALQKLLKWLGPDAPFVDLLILIGWSQLALVAAKAAAALFSVTQIGGPHTTIASNAAMAAAMGFPLWYVLLVGIAVQTLCRVPMARGVMAYIVVEVAAMLAFSVTYGSSRMTPFAQSLSGVRIAAQAVVGIDQYPWLAAGVLGLALGTWELAKYLGWSGLRMRQATVAAGLIGLAVVGTYAYGMASTNYYGKLERTQRDYNSHRYSLAAKRFGEFLPLTKDNVDLMLDVADIHYLAGEDAPALGHFGKVAAQSEKGKGPIDKARLARAHDGTGTVLYFQGKLDEAVAEFDKATKAWPEFREPWVRMAVTYARMGKYDKAIENANHATKKLDSDAIAVWTAAAEAFTQTGDKKQAEAAIKVVIGKDPDLAKRVAPKPGDWASAVDRLTREDLKFPLEKEPVQPPAKPQPKGKKSAK